MWMRLFNIKKNKGELIMKPIKISSGAFVVDSNFNIILFTAAKAKLEVIKIKKQLSNQIGYKLKLSGIKELEDYFVFTLQ